jgi:hypothetical protein
MRFGWLLRPFRKRLALQLHGSTHALDGFYATEIQQLVTREEQAPAAASAQPQING